jgi:Lon protease-like protein
VNTIRGVFDIPLFPLQTVLVPGGYLPLQIFEPRYLDMVRDCVRDECGFGVSLIMDNRGPQSASQHARVGTIASIRDWHTMDNGLLGIKTQGQERFMIQSTRMQHNGLMMGSVQVIDHPPAVAVPDSCLLLSTIVGRFMDKLSDNYPGYNKHLLEDADWVGYRLTELLPLKNLERQGLLELDDPLQRLNALLKLIPRFQ